jgi:asparagine synthase (glutamine-hydrolysing)
MRLGKYDVYDKVRQMLPKDYLRRNYLEKAQYLEMKLFLSNYLLSSQGDRVAMAHSVEIRLPYLDPTVMEFMAQVPAKWKILGLNEKHVLKKSLKELLPEEITSRNKHPYRAPIAASLLDGPVGEYTRELLAERSLASAGLFDPVKVNSLLRKFQNSSKTNEVDNMALAGVLSSQIIFQQFVDHFSPTYVGKDSLAKAVIYDRRQIS